MPAPPPAPGMPPAGVEVWHSRYGPIVIEARGGEIWVNGQRVEPAHRPADTPPSHSGLKPDARITGPQRS